MSLERVQFFELLGLADVHDRVREHPLILVHDDGAATRPEATGSVRLSSLPAVVMCVGHPGGDPPPWADLVVERGAPDLDGVAATVATNPLASIALALLLRHPAASVGAGLVAESAVYSMLQAGPEFETWRASRPHRERRPSTVHVLREDDLLRIVMDRPEVHNAFDTAMRDGLVDALELAGLDPSIERIELSGTGPSFCSGGDLDEFGARADPASAHLIRLGRSAGRLLSELSDRTTVRIHGSTMGSGIELAAFAGHVVAHRDTRIALPEVRLGLIPGAGGTVSLPRRIGRHRTMLLALGRSPRGSGAALDAATAFTWGLVDEVGDWDLSAPV